MTCFKSWLSDEAQIELLRWLQQMADTMPCDSEANTHKTGETVESFVSVGDGIFPLSETSKRSSVILVSVSSGEVVCRICRDETVDEHLISPCMCTGSLGKYHRRCLEEWLSKSTKNSCEICYQGFQTKRVNRSIGEWWRRHRRSRERRYLIGDCACFFLLTPLVLVSSYLCTQGAWHYLSLDINWTAFGLVALGAFLWIIFGIWFIMTVKFHLKTWHEWRDRNQIVHLLDAGNPVNVGKNLEEARNSDVSFRETAV